METYKLNYTETIQAESEQAAMRMLAAKMKASPVKAIMNSIRNLSKPVKLRVIQDESPESPREWDNLTVIAAKHKNYIIGDIQIDDPIDWLEEYLELEPQHIYSQDRLEALEAKFFNVVYGKRLYMYEHSGVTIKTSPFSCRWDSGQIGYVFITKEAARENYGWKRITPKRVQQLDDRIESEIAVYRDWIEGNVWGFQLLNEDGEDVDSCYGYIGDWRENAEDFLDEHDIKMEDIEVVEPY